jgi:O-antigen/teichoic acid export membrane protein
MSSGNPAEPPGIVGTLREKGFFHLLSVNLLAQALGLGSILVVARFLSPQELGEVKILQSYTALLIAVATFGYDTAILKVCSEPRSQEERAAILRLGLRRVLLATAISLAVYAALILSGLLASSVRLAHWMLVYAAVVPFAVLASILIVYLQALKKIKQMARAQAWIRLQSFLVVVACTWLWGFRGFVFATIAASAVALLPLLREARVRVVGEVPLQPVSGLGRLALLSVLGTAVGLLGQSADIFVLDHFARDREAIGYYALATIFVLGAMQVTATVQSIATPYFSERAADGRWFRRQLIRTQLRMTGLSIAVAGVLYVLARLFIPLVYSERYLAAVPYLAILLLRYILWSSYAVMGVALLGLGRLEYNLAAAVIVTPVGLGLSYLFLQRFGVSGVAWAQVVAATLDLVLLLMLTRLALRRTFGPTLGIVPAVEVTGQGGARPPASIER